MNNWIYFGVFIDNDAKNKLIKLIDEYNVQIPKNWKKIFHHMTIAFNNGSDESKDLYVKYKHLFGKQFALQVNGIGVSDDAIAVRVNYQLPISNKTPHITIAVPIGGKPVNSNYIKKWFDTKSIIINGTLQEFTK